MKNFSFKKIINIIIMLLFTLSLCSCSENVLEHQSDKISIVTVNFPQYDIMRAICGDDENVKMLIRPGAEVHGYEPSLSDILAIENADVFVYNGGESDAWIERILLGVDTSDTLIIKLMETDGISLYKEEHGHHSTSNEHNHNHAESHVGKNYDEHIWTSPKNYAVLIQSVADKLCQKLPQKANEYKKNADGYIAEINSIDSELKNITEKSEHNFIAVADRFPFLYMARDYGIDYLAAFTGCSAESDAGARVIAEMIEEVKHHCIKSVFYVELSNKKMAESVSRHTDAQPKLLHSCQNVTKEEFESGKTYADIMKENIKNLKEALL